MPARPGFEQNQARPLGRTPYELHPYKIAKALASLNELCGGRANILTGGPTGVTATMGMDEVAFKLHEDQAAAIRLIGKHMLRAFQVD